MKVNKYDLVLLRIPNDQEFDGRQPHYNTWFRVLFIDNDGTFIGRVERKHVLLDGNFVGTDHRLFLSKVLDVYQGGQWCYSDGVTVCECSGLCRDKM
jgi:hypothetical protein